MTSSQDAIERFSRSKSAVMRLSHWKSDRSKQLVVPRVIDHVTDAVDKIRPIDVLKLCEEIAADRSKHALREIKREVVDQAPTIRDWHPDFAFTHLLHFVTEEVGELVPFDVFIRHQVFKDAMYADIREQVRIATSNHGVHEQVAKNAVRWRIGNAYYSFLKEQYLISLLRSEGFNVKQHPLADALFRVDCWVGDTNIDLYVTNPRFRSGGGSEGRKIKSADLLADANPRFNSVVLECDTRHTFGDVHLPEADDVRRACHELLSSQALSRQNTSIAPGGISRGTR